MEQFYQTIQNIQLPDELNHQIVQQFSKIDKFKEFYIYNLIKQYPSFNDQNLCLNKLNQLIVNKIKEWTHSESDIISDPSFFEDFIDLMIIKVDISQFINKYQTFIQTMKTTYQEFSDLEGKPGLYWHILEHYTDTTQTLIDLLIDTCLSQELTSFYCLFLTIKSKLSPYFKKNNISLVELQSIPVNILEMLTKYFFKSPLNNYSNCNTIYHNWICQNLAEQHFDVVKSIEEYICDFYFNHVKINQYNLRLSDQQIELMFDNLGNQQMPLISIYQNNRDHFDEIFQKNHGKIIKLLQQERDFILDSSIEYQYYDFTDETNLKYQKVIIDYFKQLIIKIEPMLEHIRIDDNIQLSLNDIIKQWGLVKREQLEQKYLPNNRNFSCYINSLLMTQLSNPDSIIYQLLSTDITNLNYFPEYDTNQQFSQLAIDVKNCLILLVVRMFYYRNDVSNIDDKYLKLLSTDHYIEILRNLQQYYYILAIRQTIDIEGNQFENFVKGMHSESVVYDGFLAHLFKSHHMVTCSRVLIITRNIHPTKGIISYNQELVTNGLVRLNFMFSDLINLEEIFNNYTNETSYLIDTKNTTNLIIMNNQDYGNNIDLLIQPTIRIKNYQLDNLDYKLILNKQQEQITDFTNYNLTGMVHQNQYHKYCTIKYNNQWYHFDDSHQLRKIDDVTCEQSNNIALLFYQREK